MNLKGKLFVLIANYLFLTAAQISFQSFSYTTLNLHPYIHSSNQGLGSSLFTLLLNYPTQALFPQESSLTCQQLGLSWILPCCLQVIKIRCSAGQLLPLLDDCFDLSSSTSHKRNRLTHEDLLQNYHVFIHAQVTKYFLIFPQVWIYMNLICLIIRSVKYWKLETRKYY